MSGLAVKIRVVIKPGSALGADIEGVGLANVDSAAFAEVEAAAGMAHSVLRFRGKASAMLR